MKQCLSCAFVIFLLLSFVDQLSANEVPSKFHNSLLDEQCFDDEETESPIQWFTHMPSLPLMLQNTESLPDNNCKRQLDLYFKSLRNGMLWAVQMFDSSVKNMYGIIDGYTRHLGSFDQCYRISTTVHNKNQTELTEIHGQYCLVSIIYRKQNETKNFKKFDRLFDPYESVWEVVKERGDYRRIKRYMIQLALCIPSSCHAKEIEQILQRSLIDFGNRINMNITAYIDEQECQSRQDEIRQYSFYGNIFWFCLLVWMTIVSYSTFYDLSLKDEKENEENKTYNDLILCFSIRQNFNDIFKSTYTHRGLDCIHSLRVFGMAGIIIGHGFMQYLYNPTINTLDLEESYTKRYNMLLHNGAVLTDGFLSISGLLMGYNLLKDLDKEKKLNYLKNVMIRYIRFTPVYMVVIFFNALIFPFLGHGPFWKQQITTLHGDVCSKNWWTNLLYINNYVNASEQCMMQSWYLTVNFQCSLFAPIVIYIVWKLPRKISYIFLTILIILSAIPPFVMTYFYNVHPYLQAFPYCRKLTDFTYFYDYYIKTHMRLTPFLVGLIVGVFIYDYNFARWRLPKIWSQILIILLGPLMMAYTQMWGYKFYDPYMRTATLESALYASLHRGVFSFGACFIILLLTVGDGLDVHYKLLNPGWMQPLSKLTFSAFIVHNVLQTYRVASARTARTLNYLNMLLWDVAPEFIWCFIVSLVIAIVLEVPFRRIEKQIIFKRDTKTTLDNKKKTVNGIKKID